MGGIERRQTNGQDYGTDILNLYMIYTQDTMVRYVSMRSTKVPHLGDDSQVL